MSSSLEIVVADPIFLPDNASSDPATNTYAIASSSTQYGDTDDNTPPPFDSERLPPTLAREIQRFLRVANLIQDDEPRIAYLCRLQAFEIAHNINSSGRGVRQFKTSLLRRLEHDEETTFRKRKEKNDIRELRRVYQEYKNYIIRSGGGSDLDDNHREMLINACRIASVLYEVLKTVTDAAGHQALAEPDAHRAKSDFYVPLPYNILPLDHGGFQQAIMQFPEVLPIDKVIQIDGDRIQSLDPETHMTQLQLPEGPVTRARAKMFEEELQANMVQVLDVADKNEASEINDSLTLLSFSSCTEHDYGGQLEHLKSHEKI